jgi:hypothetical protein
MGLNISLSEMMHVAMHVLSTCEYKPTLTYNQANSVIKFQLQWK